MVIMMALPIRLKMRKKIGKPTPILLITIDQEWEVLYSPIQSKSGETIISTGILLKTHKTSHSQYTHSFYQSCLTVIDNGSMYLVEY